MKKIILILAFVLFASQATAFTAAQRMLAVYSSGTASIPGTPTGLWMSNAIFQLTATWNASTGATGYKFYYSTHSALSSTWAGSAAYLSQPTETSGIYTISTTTTVKTISSGLTGTTRYYGRVSATNAGGESTLATAVSATTGPVATNGIATFDIQSGGSGYTAGDHLLVTGPTGTGGVLEISSWTDACTQWCSADSTCYESCIDECSAVETCTTIGPTVGISVFTAGHGYSTSDNPRPTVGGTGSDMTINILTLTP